MKTNIGDINNRYSQEMKEIKRQEMWNNVMNVAISIIVVIGLVGIISFLTLPR